MPPAGRTHLARATTWTSSPPAPGMPARGSNDYAEGPDRVRGVRIRRFPVSPSAAGDLSQSTARLVGRAARPRRRARLGEAVGARGAPGLLEHLKQQQHAYDAVVFFSMSAATTVFGLPLAARRSVLFPYVQLTPGAAARAVGRGAVVAAGHRPGLGGGAAADAATTSARAVSNEELVGIGIERSPQALLPAPPAGSGRRPRGRRRTRRPTPRRDAGVGRSRAAAFPSGAGIASTARSRSTAAASSPTTAARRCWTTSTATRPPIRTRCRWC